ncbi:MAG: amylo-alpha-1,6-glucosidase [Planctomycetota bacterium]
MPSPTPSAGERPTGSDDAQRGEPVVFTREGDTLGRAQVRDEWVLTNGLGGFAMGTIAGVNTRRYHGMLIAATQPPVGRVMLLNQVHERLVIGNEGEDGAAEFFLSLFHFAGGDDRALRHPYLVRFERGRSVRWTFHLPTCAGLVKVQRELRFHRDCNACEVTYRVETPGLAARLELRPLIALRDFHGLREAPNQPEHERILEAEGSPLEDAHMFVGKRATGIGTADSDAPAIETAFRTTGEIDLRAGDHGMLLSSRGAQYTRDAQDFRGIEYWRELDRGQDCLEDLHSPAVYTATSEPGSALVASILARQIGPDGDRPGPESQLEPRERERLATLVRNTLERARAFDAVPEDADADRDRRDLARLALASDDFVVRRGPAGAHAGVSVIAGYPWFADWGRDTMISLPGLLIATGRDHEAGRVLSTFGRHRKHGVIPNRFDDNTGEAHYNTVDASLWFLHAACLYLDETGDRERFFDDLLPACEEVVGAYRDGTMFGIGVDHGDGLVTAGDASTQLTWMDAQRDGVTFTPRHGKAVEINALWYHGLRSLASAIESEFPRRADAMLNAADAARGSFRELFWNTDLGCCHDTLTPAGRQWKPVRDVRPNQVFAVSLAHSPLDTVQRRGVVRVVRERLLTPFGLRTLDPRHPEYRARFRGPLFERDAAYHNGTVWPWLIGPYAEAVLRVGEFGPLAIEEARRAIRPLLDSIDGHCPGTVAEVYDGEGTSGDPQRPDGCMAQAWSVAEPLRVLAMIRRAGAGA